ncbi:MAG: DUF2806 domain-containing protein [Candidatus Poribacteria bacterium]|nr:DUF2806 domain-containing protein [Candidatus Poribacteria bacterium]
MSDNPIMNIGDLAKPATTLIEKIADAGYILFGESYRIKQVAKAKAEAAVIEAESRIEITDLHRRAIHRWIEEEAQYQKNMEDITEKATHQLNEDADPHAIDNDWIAQFFDITRLISDDEVQNIWANILASEANNPGGFSIRTLNALKSIDKKEAEYFTRLCNFIVRIDREGSFSDFVPIVLNPNDKIYAQHGIHHNMLNHIQNDIGLIEFRYLLGAFHNYRILAEPIESLSITYHGQKLILKVPKGEYLYDDGKARVNLGSVTLTKVGFELCQICETKPINGFFEYMQTKLQDDINKTLKTE